MKCRSIFGAVRFIVCTDRRNGAAERDRPMRITINPVHPGLLSRLPANRVHQVGLTVQLNAEPDYRPCASLPQDRRAGCALDQVPSSLPVLIGAGLGLGAAFAGTYFYRNPQPIGESEAKVLADTYNQQLLQRLQLPGVARRPVLQDLKLRPYVGRATSAWCSARGSSFRSCKQGLGMARDQLVQHRTLGHASL